MALTLDIKVCRNLALIRKLAFAGVFLLASGLAFGLIQNSYYGYIDADGILHDSLFLPLSAMAILGAFACLSVAGVIALWRRMRRTG
jgi:hypothetical protein